MLKPIAQDDVARLCRGVQMDPSTYVRFALPSIALLPAPERTDATAAAEDSPADVADVFESPAESVAEPLSAVPLPETQPEQPSQALGDSADLRPAPVVREQETVAPPRTTAFVNDVVRRVSNPIESDLVALASAHKPKILQPTVLPIAPAVAGAGVTTVLACLGRAVSIIGDRVMLVDASAPSTLDYFYKRYGQENGLLLSTQALSAFEGQVHVLRTDSEAPVGAQSWAIRVHRAVAELRGRFDRILVAGRHGLTPALTEQTGSACLVVLTPDLRSRLAVPGILKMLSEQAAAENHKFRPAFVLNRFDESNPSHVECRKSLAAELGSRLLPFSIPESPTVTEALDHGVTPLDLAPQSAFTEACFLLAEWYRSQLDDLTFSASKPKETQLVSH